MAHNIREGLDIFLLFLKSFLFFFLPFFSFFFVFKLYLNASQMEQEKAMAPHSSVLAWRIPGPGEPGGLLSMGSYRVGHD